MQTKLDDNVFRISPYSSVCNRCVHFHKGARRKCDAFSEAIPLEIWEGKNDHRQPYPGDHGIQFEDARKLSAVPA